MVGGEVAVSWTRRVVVAATIPASIARALLP
ncbi:hypothetical protein EDF34_0548 [Cellulomonas sp. PhB150]|nr:hypothetical protein EDF34_0548 [Cellulomonas sp. PhB150]